MKDIIASLVDYHSGLLPILCGCDYSKSLLGNAFILLKSKVLVCLTQSIKWLHHPFVPQFDILCWLNRQNLWRDDPEQIAKLYKTCLGDGLKCFGQMLETPK